MNDTDINDDIDPDLENRIRRTFQSIAATTPVSQGDFQRRRPKRLLGVAVGLIVLAGAVGAYVAATRNGDQSRQVVVGDSSPVDEPVAFALGTIPGGTIDRHDTNAKTGPWSVVVRGANGSLGANSAVITYPVPRPTTLTRTVHVGAVTGFAGRQQVVWPINSMYVQIRGDLDEPDLIRIAANVTIKDAKPSVKPISGYTIGATIQYWPTSVREVRYSSTKLGHAGGLGNGLTYTGVSAGAAFEDQLFQTVARTGYVVRGHAAVVSDVQGGNATLAWEMSPGVIAYVGYSGLMLTEPAVTALLDLAANATPLSATEWEQTAPQVVEHANGPAADNIAPSTTVGCENTPDQPAAKAPSWAMSNGAPAALGFVGSDNGGVLAYSFVRPLLAVPGPSGPLNKVQLITQEPTSRLSIIATLPPSSGSSGVSGRSLDLSRGAPAGTSTTSTWFDGYLNVDYPGCWRFEISYNDHTDTFYLAYS